MKPRLFSLLAVIGLSTFGILSAVEYNTQVRPTTTGYLIGSAADQAIGFFGATPVVQPANTRTARQALQDVGLLATGGAQDSDVFDLTADNTLGDGVDLTLGGTDGTKIGTSATLEKLGFFNATPVVQPLSANQTALTDSTGGAVTDATLAATAGISTISIPLALASIADGDMVTAYTPGYKFKILAVDFVTTTVASTADKLSTLNVEIGTTNLTGGEVALTTASCDTLGEKTAGSAVTAANTGSASDTISVEAASTTAFAEGSGTLLIRIQNMDVQDNAAKTAELVNALRTGLVNLGLVKGSN